jgi:alkylation response protein AidB-like acyl-CoA dehydrogenase
MGRGGPLSAARDVFHSLGREHVRPSLLERDESARFDRELFLRLAGHGLFESALRGDIGEAARALAGLSHGGLDVPLGLSAAAHWIGVCLLHRFGSAEQRARYLERAVRGEWIIAVCNSEPEAGTRLRAMRSRVVPEPGGGHSLTLHKSGASNLGGAELALFSAWMHGAGEEPELAVFVMPATPPLVQASHVTQLAGFRTGLTGALSSAGALGIELDLAQLGAERSGPRILRLCFHAERLLIGALLQGCIDGLFEHCGLHLHEREARDPQFVQNQYVQEKLTLLYALARRVEGLWRLVEDRLPPADEPSGPCTRLEEGLEAASPQLGVLKLTAVDDALLAATTAYELLGYPGYQRASVVQKAHRDLLAFKMLGGSKELMKISLFRDLRASWERQPPQKPT